MVQPAQEAPAAAVSANPQVRHNQGFRGGGEGRMIPLMSIRNSILRDVN